MKQLAIVIPAYKIDFFKATLDSLAAQTCKDFTVYVGDDCSPSDFESLINEYKNKIDIHYTRFETNMGGKDLVAQWIRCIEMTQGEPWLWLFSDDDVMGNNCVEAFYNEIQGGARYDIYHFNVEVINPKGQVVSVTSKYPTDVSCIEFYKKKMSGKIDSFVVEYIFNRNKFVESGGFQHFDLAWGSDTATWVKLSRDKGIHTIVGAKVLWRKSELNITPNKSKNLSYRKLMVSIDRYIFYKGILGSENIKDVLNIDIMKSYAFYASYIDSVQRSHFFAKAISEGVLKSYQIPFIKLYSFAYNTLKAILR